jgi:hypothetical protein
MAMLQPIFTEGFHSFPQFLTRWMLGWNVEADSDRILPYHIIYDHLPLP